MKFVFFIGICFLPILSFAQQNGQNRLDRNIDATISKTLTLNIQSKEFVRIVDGIKLNQDFVIPKSFKINSIWRLSDSVKLKKLGIENFEKPYMLLSSFASDTRRFIYKIAHIRYQFQELNLPIFLNNQLITFDKYSLLNNLDTTLITTAKYIKPTSKVIDFKNMPFGFIKVTAKETTFR